MALKDAGLDYQERVRLQRELVEARQAFQSAKTRYEAALRLAHKGGVPFTSMAVCCGVSEAAIRLQFKRRGWR